MLICINFSDSVLLMDHLHQETVRQCRLPTIDLSTETFKIDSDVNWSFVQTVNIS